ncbi:MAG: hypothetical protein ACE364_01505 [Chlorobiota bacterium]
MPFEILEFIVKLPTYLGSWLDFLMLLITVSAVLVALFNERINRYFNRIELEIVDTKKIFFEPHFQSEEDIHIFLKYYLKVKNINGKTLIKNAKIRLLRISQETDDEPFIYEFTEEALFKWNNLENDSFKASFLNSNLFYFGYIYENSNTNKFSPFYISKESFFLNGVAQNQRKIYEIEILADNFISKDYFYIQVSYDGIIINDMKEQLKHLKINIVNSIDDFNVN